uniref:Nudix hydrolase domain-containing protein n=1 Tax=Eutreptiella gymnastica TaxID=73025 RepID=A0A7S4CWT8_9EUGL
MKAADMKVADEPQPLLTTADGYCAPRHETAKCPDTGRLKNGQILRIDDLASTRWIKFQALQYKDPRGRVRSWDMVSRNGYLPPGPQVEADAVTIFPRLWREGEPAQTILVKQFRPPLGTATIEVPAGLIDEGETAEAAALRELQEETGYRVGTVASVSQPLTFSPGLTNESTRLVVVDVDLDDPGNQDPQQKLDDEEDIEVEIVPLSGLLTRLREYQSDGYVVYDGLWCLAMGMTLGERGSPQG